jgi:bifunctional DNase/RNase
VRFWAGACCLLLAPVALAQGKPEKGEKPDKAAASAERLEEAHSPQWAEAEVWQVIPDPSGGGIVLLRTKASPKRIVPISIGISEALAIRMKMTGMTFARPLTHDLLDHLIRELGARIVKVRIEKLASISGHDGGTFFGRIFVRQGHRQFDVDARASDSIAMALRNDAPIFVATPVIEKAGIDAKQFEEGGDVESPQKKPHETPSEPL